MRYHYMDLLRGILMAVGVVFHTSLVVAPRDWNISTHVNSEFYTYLAKFIHSFRMEAFFLLSGFFAAMLLSRMSRSDYISKRLNRILIPFIVAAVTLNLLMFRNESWNLNFWLGGEWLSHLWFLGHLALYMLATALLYPVIRRVSLGKHYSVFVVVIALLAMCAAGVSWKLPEPPYGHYWVFISFDRLLPQSVFFFAGIMLYQQADLFESAHRVKLNGAIALASGAILLLNWGSQHAVMSFVRAVWALSLTGALLGTFRTFLNRNEPWVRFMADSSYTLYLFHQPLLVIIGAYCLSWNPHLFFITFVTGITLLCWWFHATVISRSAWLSFLYNGKPLNSGNSRPASNGFKYSYLSAQHPIAEKPRADTNIYLSTDRNAPIDAPRRFL